MNTAVIVNELGEVGLDHLLLERLDGETVLLPQGCLCCALSGTLEATLESLDIRRANGEIPAFDRVIVETTGLAKPAPIVQALLDRAVLLRGYTPGLVVTAVDAANGAATLERHREAVQQVAMADRLLLTKPDLASGPALRRQLRALNPGAPITQVLHGALPLAVLDGSANQDLATSPRPGRFTADAGHARAIATTTLILTEPPAFTDLADWLGGLVARHGPALLRVKGIVRVLGEARPIVVHGVQHVFHPPARLDRWPPGLAASTLVFILDGLDPGAILDSARAAGLRCRTTEQEMRDVG